LAPPSLVAGLQEQEPNAQSSSESQISTPLLHFWRKKMRDAKTGSTADSTKLKTSLLVSFSHFITCAKTRVLKLLKWPAGGSPYFNMELVSWSAARRRISRIPNKNKRRFCSLCKLETKIGINVDCRPFRGTPMCYRAESAASEAGDPRGGPSPICHVTSHRCRRYAALATLGTSLEGLEVQLLVFL